MSSGRVAVIVPYFQRDAGLLVAAIRSVLAQSDAPLFTIIVCDDDSPRPAALDIDLLTGPERESVVVIRQANAGAGAARNTALRAVPPDAAWIAFLDSDDQWQPDHIRRSLAALEAGYDLCFSDARREHEELSHFQALSFGNDGPAIGTLPGLRQLDADFLTLNIVMSPVSISTVVMRVSALGDLRFRPIPVEDLMFWFDAARRNPRVAYDATLQVIYGRGNITVSDNWKSPAMMRMALMYHRIFVSVVREFPLSHNQRALLQARMAGNRAVFCRILLAQLRMGVRPARRIVAGFLAIDPHVAATLIGTAANELADRLPFRRPPSGFALNIGKRVGLDKEVAAMSVAKQLLERFAGRAGVEITPKWRVPGLPYVRRLQTMFEAFGITAIIDIGANAGQFHDQMRTEVGFTGQIFSFEPDPTLAERLQRRAAASDKAWTIFPMALGSEPGVMQFNIMHDPVYNSFNAPSVASVRGHERGNTVVRTIEVEVATLDAMAQQFPDLAHTYLKIDTQGFDLEVIKGGSSVVRTVPAMQTEISVKPIYVGSPTMEDSIATLTGHGFTIADMFLVSTDGEHRAVEFDCIMVRDKRDGPTGLWDRPACPRPHPA